MIKKKGTERKGEKLNFITFVVVIFFVALTCLVHSVH